MTGNALTAEAVSTIVISGFDRFVDAFSPKPAVWIACPLVRSA
jgi:hypothetical protein